MPAVAGNDPPAGELFATETMAELCARQGRLADAAAIFRQLLETRPGDERAGRWAERVAVLGAQTIKSAADPTPPQRAERAEAAARAVTDAPPEHRLPLVVRETVRSGQIVYAQATDLIVLAPVNPGAQLLADGNIHVYAPLRGRAVAGARGAREARIFCQRLEAELVGIDAAYVLADAVPPELYGKPAQIRLDGDRCVLAPL